VDPPLQRRALQRHDTGRVYWRRRTVVVVVTGLVAAAVSIGIAQATSPDLVKGAHVATTAPATRSLGTTAASTPQPPFGVQDETITLSDPSRETSERGDVPARSGRVLTTVIRRPEGAVGPLPLVVFAHGWDSDPYVYESLLDTWAAAGYLVAAPTFPDSADTLPGSPVTDFPNEARDLSFLITAMLNGVAGKVDPARIAVAGHSDGGTDVAMLALNPAFADHRIRAYVSLSSQIPAGVDGPWGAPTPGALMVAVGTDDEYGLYPDAYQVYQSADMAKVFVSAAGGDHLDTFVGTIASAIAMREETVKFLDDALGRRGATSLQLVGSLIPTGDPALVVNSPPPGA
jgi:poly(3-hydroxybutyrate) depolymerase